MLAGIKVVDFTRLLPGPMTTHLMAQMGAQIIKIESPKRQDYARKGLKQVNGMSPLFHQINHLKDIRSIDYNTDSGRAEIFSFLKDADVLIEQFRPGAMDAWGLGYNDIKSINPKLIYASITGYGQSGEYAKEAGHDLNYLAYSGILSLIKSEDGKLTTSDTQFADLSGAYMAVMAVQSALIKMLKSGVGSYIDISLCKSMLPFLTVPKSLNDSGVDYRDVNIINGKVAVNYSVYCCADYKWIAVGALELKFWNNLCDSLNRPTWKRSNQIELLNTNFDKGEVEDYFLTKNRDEWILHLKGKDVCVSPVLEIEELESHPMHRQGSFEKINCGSDELLTGIKLSFKVT